MANGTSSILFFLIPSVALIAGARFLLGLNGEKGAWQHLVGLPILLFGLLVAYLDWVYVNRPVKGEEVDNQESKS